MSDPNQRADRLQWNEAAAASKTERSGLRRKVLRIRHLVRKEFIQLVRNKQNFGMLLIAPIFQLLLFGYAVDLDVKNVATVVVDMDRTSTSRSLIDSFTRSGYFRLLGNLDAYDQADWYLDRGKATMALLIPPDFQRRIQGLRTAQVGVLIDGVDTTTANTVAGYAEGIVRRFSTDQLQSRIELARGIRFKYRAPDLILPSIDGRPRAWFNPNLTSKNYFVPGTLVLILMFTSVTVTSMIIVREKERGTIEQIMVTPLTKLEVILGKSIPSFLISVINLVVMTGLGFLVFDPIFIGSFTLFFGAGILFIVTCLGIGMTISVFCKTQQQAILSTFMVLQPSVLLSGFVFPIDNMPVVIQYVTYLNPLRYFLIIVRDVFLKGIGVSVLWTQILPIAVMAVGFIVLASALFRKKID